MEEKWFLEMKERTDLLHKRLKEKITKEQKDLEEFKKNSELQSKIDQELKINEELAEQLTNVTKRCTELDRVCATFDGLTIADSDKNRLDNAKDMYQIGKEMTGVRFDFSAPPNVVKGYVKNVPRKLLEVFEIDAENPNAVNKLWAIIRATTTPGWPELTEDKENVHKN